MSRIGNAIITIPKEATVTISDGRVLVKGPKGELSLTMPSDVMLAIESDVITVTRGSDSKRNRALHGFVRAEVANMITGVTAGWTKTLELSGVGYRAAMTGNTVTLNLGFSHPVVVTPPPGVTFSIVDGKVLVSGTDKQVVGETAAKIRALKKPEPYKGKGIKYQGERIRKKAGKTAKAVGGAPGGK